MLIAKLQPLMTPRKRAVGAGYNKSLWALYHLHPNEREDLGSPPASHHEQPENLRDFAFTAIR